MAWENLQAELAEELGTAQERGREWFDGEGHSFGRLPALPKATLAADPLIRKLADRKARLKWLASLSPAELAAYQERNRQKSRAWKLANPERARALDKANYQRNRDRRRAQAAAYYHANKGRQQEKARARAARRYEEKRAELLAYAKRRRQTPEVRAAAIAAQRRWYARNRERILAEWPALKLRRAMRGHP